ncbi:MAG: YkvA family protein [Planctomycetota bacterium]|nr:YkvA family protein [Planctomycetota bacterium]
MDSPSPNPRRRLKARSGFLKRQTIALYLAMRHPATPWYAKVLAALVVAYALSPIDLIPDPIPVLGYLDDLVIVPLGLLAVRWMIPRAVLDECLRQADRGVTIARAWLWAGAIVVATLWLAALAALALWTWRRLGH